jgi:hypothetical protein
LAETNDYDLIDIYAEDVEEMDAGVATIVALQLIVGVMVTPNLLIILTGGFPTFGIYSPPHSFLMTFANLAYTSILFFLVIASIYVAWTLWRIVPRARLYAIVVNFISFVVHIITLSLVIVFNLIILYYVNTRQMKEIYSENPSSETFFE